MKLTAYLRQFLRSEDGSFSILSVYFVLIAAIMGGLAIDFQNRQVRETKMQTAVDAVAHAALYTRSRHKTAAEARAVALELAQNNLPEITNGQAIQGTDIEFGVWDSDAQTFSVDETARDAVRVTASRTVARDNIVENLLLDIIGYRGWEVQTTAIFQIWEPPCFQNGFNAKMIVDTRSNNIFGSDFCMHANQHVELSSNNTFYAGSVVSMPDTADLQLPSSGMESNIGLADALRNGWYQFKVLDQLGELNTDLRSAGTLYTPDYISGVAPIYLSAGKVAPEDFTPGRIHIADCSTGPNNITFEAGNFSTFVLITDCSIKFNEGVGLEDTVVFSESTSARAFSSPASLRLGKDDSCAPGGGAFLYTYGGFEAAADLEIYGSQIVAAGDVEFAANATGVQGVSIVAGGDVETTSNVHMNGCDNQGGENILVEEVMRMVY